MSKLNTIKQNLTQVALIVFSVVLGLYLSERIEERKNKKASDNLLMKVKSEVADNTKLMKEWGGYHREIYQKLDSLSKREEFVEGFIKDKSIIFEKVLTKGTFMERSPSSDAWDIAKSHPLIVNFDYDKLVILSKIYDQQESTFEPMYKMFELFSSKDVNKEKEAKANLESMSERMFELIAREKQLMNFYRDAKGILELDEMKWSEN